ncbi:MAG TPA: TolC family protein [Vicinamibacterales bacterium]|nr:TolC family protein [Vicinamibacterales bacterium]
MHKLAAAALASLVLLSPAALSAQTTPPVESVTLDQAVERALKNNPTVGQAIQGILRAEALLQQARAVTLPQVNASFTGVVNSTERKFDDVVTSPRMQGTIAASASMPVLAAADWARRNQAKDQVEVANLSSADVRTNIAVATGQAYLAIIAARRQVDVSLRARESALAHLDYARRRLEAGAGTRLNELRAAQEVSSDEARLEVTQYAVRVGQEALGVLMASNGPVDAASEPAFNVPAAADEAGWMALRPDLRLFTAEERAADRVWRDSSKDWFPTGVLSFDPQALVPASIFTSARSWRLVVNFSQPIWDSGQRKAVKLVRETNLNNARLALTDLQIRARSEVRLAEDLVRTSERAFNSLRLAAEQAQEVLNITNFAFQAGATTNLEVIDAQRQARDADSSAAVAQNTLMRAQLDLLTALGRFPQ